MSKKVIVIGAGAWGGWSAFKLQEAGYEVTLIDKSSPGNSLSGSGGKTRIIRMAYGGHPIYTQMVHQSFQDWEHYANQWEEQLYHPKGAIWLFRDIPSTYAEASIPLMTEMGYKLHQVDLDDGMKRFPEISFTDITSAYWEDKVWFLEAAKSCVVVAREFEKIGGRIVQDTVVNLDVNDNTIIIRCNNQQFETDQVIVAAGPWSKQLIPELKDVIHISRQEVYYFDAPKSYCDLPIWVEFREGDQMYYGIPDHFMQGFKFAYDERQWPLDPDLDHREISPDILAKMSAVLTNRFPELDHPSVLKHHTCVYENALDGDFIIDQKADSRIIYMAGSSGHGFKMGPAIGHMILDHLLNKKPLPSQFAICRFHQNQKRKSQYQMNQE